ncbi:MAG: rhodanese-like domain-containing protein [Campylobacterales bacterium]|nr:rhodanese-like domain-containing protein [Campylobacterales bacterium]
MISKKFFLIFIPTVLFSNGFLLENKNCEAGFQPTSQIENYKIISLKETKELYKKKVLFIDARSKGLYDKGTIKNSINIPSNQYIQNRGKLVNFMDKDIVIFCSGINCGKSADLAQQMDKDGFNKIYLFEEGYPYWRTNNLPTTSEQEIDDPFKLGTKGFNKISSRSIIIDVRTKEEYNCGHLKRSVNVPIKQKKENFIKKIPKDKTIIFICKTGSRAYDAVDIIKSDKSFKNTIYYYDGEINCSADNSCKFSEFIED